MTETDSGSESLAGSKRPVVWKAHTHICACRIIGEAIITVLATLSGRNRRRQVHYRLYSQLAFCDKHDEHVAPCWKTGGEIFTGKTIAVLCNVLLFVVLWNEEDRSWVSEHGKLRRKDICGCNECSQVKFINPVNCGCPYTTACTWTAHREEITI